LPYGTSYWQVGDSSEQNGCFKMALNKAKQELVTRKNSAGQEYAIHKSDIVGLVRKAWGESFARIETNRKAILQRGWGPRALNYNALLHPEVLTSKPGYSCDKPAADGLTSQVTPDELNLSEGLAGTLVDRIFIHKSREAGNTGNNAVDQMKKRKATAEANLRSHDKRITAGLLAAAGRYHLSEDIRDHVQERANAKEQMEYDKQLKKKDDYDALSSKVQAIRLLNLPPERLNQAQLKIMLRWYRRDGDEKLPTKKQDQVARFYATSNREDLPAPQLPPVLNQVNNNAPTNQINNDVAIGVPVASSNMSYSNEEQELAALLATGFSYEQEVRAAEVIAAAAAATAV
jgi:hypothetical protein